MTTSPGMDPDGPEPDSTGVGVAHQKLDIEVTDHRDHKVVRPGGDLDVYTAGKLRDTISSLVEEGTVHIVVDLDAVPFMDSSGLGALMGGMRRLREAGGDMAVACTLEPHLKLFEITGFNQAASLAPSVEQAAGELNR